MAQLSDDAFLAFAKQQEAEATKKPQGEFKQDFEELKWTGLETGRMKVIRAVGGPPDSKLDDTTAKTVRISRIIGDNGKQFRCIFPDRGEDESHILWRIMSRVNAVEWDADSKKTFVNEKKFPEIFNIVNKNGLAKDDKRFRFERGWMGRHVVIMNVIDREQMDWHRENKHTMLLSRNIGVANDGRLFPEEGIPTYGFLGPISILFKHYKSWQRYDIGVLRTGQMQSPYHIVNAGVNIVEVPEDIQDKVSREMLTEEEAGWERYDLNRLFGITSSTKIYNRLKGTIAKIDATLGTNFLSELKHESDKEREKWERENNDLDKTSKKDFDEEDGDDMEGEKESTYSPEAAKPRPARPVVNKEGFDTSLLKGWDKLKESERDAIEDIVIKEGKVTNIIYKDKSATVYACPECGAPAPDSFVTCPKCSVSF